jgi:hypothetical protein
MQTIFDSARPVKSARPAGERREPYTQADLDWVAEFFGRLEDARLLDEENHRLDELAAEAEWLDRLTGAILTGHCLVCGDHAELTSHGLCDRCDTAATNATIACQNKTAMGQYSAF